MKEENVHMFEFAESQHFFSYIMYILEDGKEKTCNKQSTEVYKTIQIRLKSIKEINW